MQHLILASDVSHELNCQAVPYPEIIRAITSLPYANVVRIAFLWSFATGARPSEVSGFTLNGRNSFLKGNYFYFRVGKNQRGQWRRETISTAIIEETRVYRENNRLPHDRVIGVSAETLGRYFNRDIRPLLGGTWLKRVAVPQKGGIHEFVLQYKGLRKSFACLAFWSEFVRWKDAGAAFERVSARLHHSTIHITANHYLKDLDSLDLERWGLYSPCEILEMALEQRRLDPRLCEEIGSENWQSCLLDF